MTLWLLFALLSIGTLALLLRPLLRGSEASSTRADYDMVVYRNQLAEIGQDLERGLLPQDQADAARAEIHRRMLAAEDAESEVAPAASDRRGARLAAASGVIVALVLGSTLVYTQLGSPRLVGVRSDQVAAGGPPPNPAAAAQAAELAATVEANPSVTGFKELGDAYYRAQQYDLAAGAYQRSISLGAHGAQAWSDFGEAIVMGNDGAVVLPALEAFVHALEADVANPRARFYIGLAEAQIGEFRRAVAILRDLERDGAPNSRWLPMVRDHISEFARRGGFDAAAVAPQPPSLASLNASVAAMSQAQGRFSSELPSMPANGAQPAMSAGSSAVGGEAAMIEGMVDRLAARLRNSPRDAPGWELLIRSQMVLNRPDAARASLNEALAVFSGDPVAQAKLRQSASAAGLH